MAFKEWTPDEWITEIEHGLEYRRIFGIETKWGEFEAIYYNVTDTMMNDGPNIFYSQGDSMLSGITVPVPKILIKAASPESVNAAPILEALDNTLIRTMDMRVEVERCALHTYLFGRGIMKIGYDSEWGYDAGEGALNLGMSLSQLTKDGGRRIEYDSTIQSGTPWVRAIPPHDIVVPWGTLKLTNCPWIAHRIVRHIDDLKADSKYKNTGRINAMMSMRDFVESYRTAQRTISRRMNTSEPEYVEMYEIHDRRTGKVYVVVPDHDKFLRNDVDALQIEGRLPFVSMSFTPVCRSFWVTPDTFYLYHVQNELSDVALQRTKQRRISTLKFLYDEDTISTEEFQKITSTDVGVGAKIQSGREITKAIMKLDSSLDQGLAIEEEMLRANAREQIGFSRNQQGEFQGGRKTATEVAAVDASSKLRMSRRSLAMKTLYEGMFKQINGLIFANWQMARYVEVIGPQRAETWVQANGAQLKGKYNYDVNFTDESQMQGRKMEALQLYGVLSQDPAVDVGALIEFLTNEFNDPAFGRIFDAAIRGGVQGGAQGRNIQQNGAGGQSQAPPMQRLRGANNQASGGF